MKSKSTTYMLLAAVAVIWGAIAWKLLSPNGNTVPTETAARPATITPAVPTDTIVVDYPDPFLKKSAPERDPKEPPRKSVPTERTTPANAVREDTVFEHLAAIRSKGRTIHVIIIGGEQYEIERGDSAAGFVAADADRDSLYLMRRGIKYGVKLCE